MRRWLSRAGERGAVKAIALPVLLLVMAAGYYVHQDPPAAKDQEPETFRISVDVALVVLHATVSDRQGGFVSDLCEQDFVVYEDGVPQSIRLFRNEDIPVTVGLVVDHSGTMGPKLAEVLAAARTFVQASNEEDEMFVVNFNETVSLGLPGTVRFTNSAGELEYAITTAPIGGQTALYDAIGKALEVLQAGSREKKVLIVISDGGDNVSELSQGQVMKLAEQASAVIYTVGLFDEDDPDQNPRVLRRLAQSTGGEAYFPGELSEAVAISERIARDIRHQYTIGYIPTSLASDGAYRAIRVTAGAKGRDRLSVRTRTGYRTGGERRLGDKVAK